MINISSLYKTYKVGSVETKALVNVNFEVKRGDFVVITGKSGCGKSTLLNVLGLMDTFESGEYVFNGKPIHGMGSINRAKFRNRTIGFVFQMFNLMDGLTALENVEVPMGYGGVSSKERNRVAVEMLQRVGLSHKLKSYPRHLSGGEQQRVSIARALANSPEIILADEPTGNLDEKNSSEIMEILKDMNKSGSTIVMVTHDQNLATIGNQIIKMQDGKIVGAV